MDQIWQAIVLGAVQGLTEFMPISSSAHLTLIPWLFGWDSPFINSLTFDVALHIGTLVAVLIYFGRDLSRYLMAGVRGLFDARVRAQDLDFRLAWLIVLATVPGVLAGILLESAAERAFRDPRLIAVMLIVMGLVLFAADQYGRRRRKLEDIKARDALSVGLAQALALIPGVSRSGSTISLSLILGLRRESAARFSFLLSVPITLGAIVKKMYDLIKTGLPGDERAAFVAGILVSGVVGFLCIAFLMRYLQRNSFAVFVIYRLGLGLLVLGIALLGLRTV